MDQPPPEVLALIIADHVHRDDVSGRFSIVGTRAAFTATAFPFDCPNLAVYVNLIEGRGQTTLRLRLVDVDETHDPLVEYDTSVTFVDPTQELEIGFILPDIEFPEPGDYRLQLYVSGQFVRERRIMVARPEDVGTH